jgi:hypothetical protein
MPSRQQRTGLPETIGTPSWTAFLAPNQTIRRKGWLNDGKIRRQASSTIKPSAPVPFGFAFDRLARGILRLNPAWRPFDSAILAFRDQPFKARLARRWNSVGSIFPMCLGRCGWADVVLLAYDADPIAAGGGGHTDLRVTII